MNRGELRRDLLREHRPARSQDASDLRRKQRFVAVEHEVEGLAREGQNTLLIAHNIDAERAKPGGSDRRVDVPFLCRDSAPGVPD